MWRVGEKKLLLEQNLVNNDSNQGNKHFLILLLDIFMKFCQFVKIMVLELYYSFLLLIHDCNAVEIVFKINVVPPPTTRFGN